MDEHCTAASDRLAFLLKTETAYKELCDSLEQSENKQTRICAMFLKMVGSYLRCKDCIQKHDVLLLEEEINDWLGMWKETGKTAYLAAGLQRIENLYYNIYWL